MKLRRVVGFLIIAALFVPLGRAAAHKGGSAEEARRAIEATNAKYGDAVQKGDAAAIVALYTKDAILLPDDGEMIRSSPAKIEEFWKASFKAGVKAAKLETLDVERMGDVAVETGRFAMTIQPEGKEATTAKGKYVVVWKREGDSWKLHRDIWNSDPAAK